jgi:sortase A
LVQLTQRHFSSVLTAIGVLSLTIAAEAVLQDQYAQWSGRRDLTRKIAPPPDSGAAVPTVALSRPRPARAELLGMLNVPRLGLSVVVLEGSDDIVLKKGPGHIEDTAYPGEHGNVAIAGHRNTHFKPLEKIRQNDEIVLETKRTTIRYFVDSVQILKPTNMEVLDPTPGPALTLVTCYPFQFVGNAPMRFIVRATPRPEAGQSNAKDNR